MITLRFVLASTDKASLPPGAWVLLAAMATALFTYLGLRLKNSGSIRTTEPEIIFKAGEDVRHELVELIIALKADLQQLKIEYAAYRKEAEEKEENWRKRVSQLEDELFDVTERLRREEIRNARS